MSARLVCSEVSCSAALDACCPPDVRSFALARRWVRVERRPERWLCRRCYWLRDES